MTKKSMSLGLLLAVTAASHAASPVPPPATVKVGSPGNAADGTGYGAVPYEYAIGKFEVTNEEYCQFLNGAAKSDPHQLYDSRMSGNYGGIFQSGESGSYTYTISYGMGKMPVNFVTWESGARYANWLSNGGGSGDTEQGAYTFNSGQVTVPDHAALAAGDTLKWAIPTENEWYKAAYFDPSKSGGAGYWSYAGKGDSAPKCNLSSDGPTAVGSYESSPSPWGTFDQNGNMWEYNETMSGGKVGLRGGSFYLNDHAGYLLSGTRYDVFSAKWPNYGFRVVALGKAKAKAEEPKEETEDSKE
jgi:formylglycine-generating enzyme